MTYIKSQINGQYGISDINCIVCDGKNKLCFNDPEILDETGYITCAMCQEQYLLCANCIMINECIKNLSPDLLEYTIEPLIDAFAANGGHIIIDPDNSEQFIFRLPDNVIDTAIQEDSINKYESEDKDNPDNPFIEEDNATMLDFLKQGTKKAVTLSPIEFKNWFLSGVTTLSEYFHMPWLCPDNTINDIQP